MYCNQLALVGTLTLLSFDGASAQGFPGPPRMQNAAALIPQQAAGIGATTTDATAIARQFAEPANPGADDTQQLRRRRQR